MTPSRESARRAGLRYVEEGAPGLTRLRRGSHFRYLDRHGRPVREPRTLARIAALAISPAWHEVWISPHPKGHVQAWGRDARGRKQYRYHQDWQALRGRQKYQRLLAFSRALPKIHAWVNASLSMPGLPRRKVVAAVIALLERTLIRVGNDEYAAHNHSFGLTTLRERHVDVKGAHLRFHFRGKSKTWHEIELVDRRLARIVDACLHAPGPHLFTAVEGGVVHRVHSGDVNAALRDVMGEDFTAKDFRTWAATCETLSQLRRLPPFATQRQAKQNLAQAVREVASRLGNTPAVCRRSYIHPVVVDTYLEGKGWPSRGSEAAAVVALLEAV